MSDPFGNISIQPGAPSPAQPTEPEPETETSTQQTTTSQAPPGPPTSPKRPQRHTIKKSRAERWILLLILLVVCYCAAGFYLVPFLLKKGADDLLRQTSELEMSTGRLTFNPFTFELAASNLILERSHPESGLRPPLHVERIYTRIDPLSFWGGGKAGRGFGQIQVSELLVVQPSLHLRRLASGQLDLQLRPMTAPPSWLQPLQRLGLRFMIQELTLQNGSIILNDQADYPADHQTDQQADQQTHIIDQITFTLPDLTLGSTGDANTKADIDARVVPEIEVPVLQARINGSPLRIASEVGRNELGQPLISLACYLNDLDLPRYTRALALPLQLKEGRGDTQLQIIYSPQSTDADRLRFEHQTTVSLVELHNGDAGVSGSQDLVDFRLTAPEMVIKGSWLPISGRQSGRQAGRQAGRHQLEQFQLNAPQISGSRTGISQQIGNLLAQLADTKQDDNRQPLFSMNDGRLTLRDINGPERSWGDLQLIIDGPATDGAPTAGAATPNFNLSGRNESSQSLFHWRGGMSEELLSGPLSISEMPASELFAFLQAPGSEQATELGPVKGTLTGILQLNLEPDQPLQASLRQGQVQMQNLQLTSNKREWLRAGIIKIEDIRIADIDLKGSGLEETKLAAGKLAGSNGVEQLLDLGRITITDARLNLQADAWPPLLGQHPNWSFQSLELAGQMHLSPRHEAGQPLKLDDLQISYRPQHSKTKQQAATDSQILRATIAGQGKIQLHTQNGSTGKELLALKLSQIPARSLATWLPPIPLIRESSGLVNATGQFNWKRSLFSGSVELGAGQVDVGLVDSPDLATLVDQVHQPDSLISWQRANFQDLLYDLKQQSVHVGRLNLEGPRGSWQQRSADSEPGETGAPVTVAAAAAATLQRLLVDQSAPGPTNTIDLIQFQQGVIDYQDQRLNPPWQTQITEIAGSISALAPESHTRFQLSGQISQAAFELQGEAALFGDPLAASPLPTSPLPAGARATDTQTAAAIDEEWTLTIQQLALDPFQEQFAQPLALDASKAQLDLHLSQKLESTGTGTDTGTGPRALLNFSNLQAAGDQAPGHLVLALLQNAQQQFSTELTCKPHGGPLAQQWADLFRGLSLKARVAPLLLTGPFKHLADSNGLEAVAGQAQLQPTAQALIKELAALLQARPGLGLILTGLADPLMDHSTLLSQAEIREQQRVEQENQRHLDLWQELQEQQEQQEQSAAELQAASPSNSVSPAPPSPSIAAYAPISPQPVTIDDERLLDLAKERAFLVYDQLTSEFQIDSSRLRLEQGRLSSTPPGNQVLFSITAL